MSQNTNTQNWTRPSIGEAGALAVNLQALIPSLFGPRIMLRAPKIEDWSLYREIMSGPRSIHMGGPYDEEASWLDFCQAISSWLLRGFGLWSVVNEDQLIGFIFFHHEYQDAEPELGFMFDARFEGKSLAYEAAICALNFVQTELGQKQFVSYIHQDNMRSINLARRLGARLDESTLTPWPELKVYRFEQGAMN